MQANNPTFNDKTVDKVAKLAPAEGVMTVQGTIAKTGFLLAALIATAAWSWGYTEANPDNALWLVLGGGLAAFVVAMLMIFRSPSPILALLYALLEGIVIGAVSFLFNSDMQGIVMQAITLTLGVTLSMLVLYSFRIVKVTEKFRSVILIATVGVVFFYLISWIISLFSSSFADFVYTGGSGVIISGIIVIIAALNLLLDFDFIEKGSEKELPKAMEWYGAFGLMVTLIWLYISILRMLGASRN